METYGFVFSNFGTFLKVASAPMLLVVLLSFLQVSLGGGVVNFLLGLLATMAMIPLATAWHRCAILPEAEKPGWFKLTLGKAELSFLLRFLAASGIYLVTFILFNIISGALLTIFPSELSVAILIILSVSAGWYLASRFCLVFPAAAIGATAGFGDSWRATRGCVWRIVFVFVLIALPVLAAAIAVQYLGITLLFTPGDVGPGGQLGGVLLVFAWISNIVIYLVATAVMISGLSLIFKFLTARDMQHFS